MKRLMAVVTLAACLAACSDEQASQTDAPEEGAVIAAPAAPPLPEAMPAKATPAPAVVVAKKPEPPEPLPSLPATPIDLSVPQELIDELRLGEPVAAQPPEPLLPPLFIEKPKPPSKFQLNGRLLLNEQINNDYSKSVEGAELQLQFKH